MALSKDNLRVDRATAFFIHRGKNTDFGAAGEILAVFFEQIFEVSDHRFGEVSQLALNLLNRFDDVIDILAILIHVKERDTPDGDFEQAFDVFVHQIADKEMLKIHHPGVDLVGHGLGGFCLFDALINAVFDENLFEGQPVLLVGEVL